MSARQRALVFLQLWDPGVAEILRVLAFPQDRAAARAAAVDDELVDVGAAHALRDRVHLIEREVRPQRRLELVLPCFALELLRALLRLSLQVFDLPPHIGELAFFLGVFQAVLLRQAHLGFGDDAGAFVVEPSLDRQLEVLLFLLQFALPLAHRQLRAPRLGELLRLRVELVPEPGHIGSGLLLGGPGGVFPRLFDFFFQLAVELGPHRGLDLGAQRPGEGDLLSAGRACNRLFGHGTSLRRQFTKGW